MQDLSNQTFGKLAVISRAEGKTSHTYYLCICRCGKQIITRASYLKTGRSKSCGCGFQDGAEISNARRFKDLEGRRFGRLKVVELHRKIGNVFYWETKCNCGNTFIANGDQLKRGLCKSCGCLKCELITLANKKNVGSRNRDRQGRFSSL